MAQTDNFIQQPVLTLAGARKAIAAAEAEALKNKWPVVIAVCDAGGNLIALARLDNAQFGSVEVAMAKARSAVAYKRSTRIWDETLHGGRTAVLGLPGLLPSEGGEPVLVNGVIVGGIGVSGVKPTEDGQIARAGAAVIG